MVLIGFLSLALSLGNTPALAAVGDSAATVRRIAATAELAAQEYRLGVIDGRVVQSAEVEESRLFLKEARRAAAELPAAVRRTIEQELSGIIGLVDATASPDSVRRRVDLLVASLAQRLSVPIDQLPAFAPSLLRGAEIYREACASCHGDAGRGDGPGAQGLTPAPSNLADAAVLSGSTPLDFYRRITVGVVGTAMPGFESHLTSDDRWAVAAYATLLRLPKPTGGEVPRPLRSFSRTATMSDDALAIALGLPAGAPATLARVAAVRDLGDEVADAADLFVAVRAELDSAYALAGAGDRAAASGKSLDAYMAFEGVERTLKVKDPGLATELEAAFSRLRNGAAAGASAAEMQAIRGELAAKLDLAERRLSAQSSPFNLFVQSFILLLREGLEAILIVGALLTFLVKTGAGHRKRDVHLGVGAAVLASLLTAVLLEGVFRLAPGRREALEGVTLVAASAVLFYVSYWLISKMEVVKWNQFVKSRVHQAVTHGSALALASAAFLAVYREGFETVLFYKALFLSGGAGGGIPVVSGMIVGALALALVYVLFSRFGAQLPLKPFFGVTSAFLYYMAFVFIGKGIAELQEGGILPATRLSWAPELPALGIFPTAESLGAQSLLLLLCLVALAKIFVYEPRRLNVTPVMVPDAPPLPAAAVAADPARSGTNRDLLRSLERVDADLAEIRAEVERMRDSVRGTAAERPASERPSSER